MKFTFFNTAFLDQFFINSYNLHFLELQKKEFLHKQIQYTNQHHQQQMIIPQFKLDQTPTHIKIYIRVPYLKVSACEFYIQQYEFKFYLKPYLLSLNLESGLRMVEEPDKCVYYHEKYILEVWLLKEHEGEVFGGLELMGKVAGKGKNMSNQGKKVELVEVIGKEGEEETQVLEQPEQDHPKYENPFAYGFCNNYSKVFQKLDEQCQQLFLVNPHTTQIQARHQASIQSLKKQFDIQSYLYDKYENNLQIKSILLDKSAQSYLDELKSNTKNIPSLKQFKSQLKLNKQILVSASSKKHILKQLVSLFFCYYYELICMTGDFGIESAKTINRTSGVLGCCLGYEDVGVQEVIRDCCRRCFGYSLYQHMGICQKVKEYMSNITKLDLIVMVRSLRQLFEQSEPRYLLNRVFLDDYLIYLLEGEQPTDQQIEKMRKDIGNMVLEEDDLNMGVKEYEQEQQEEDDDEEEQEERKKKEEKKDEKQKKNSKEEWQQLTDQMNQMLRLD